MPGEKIVVEGLKPLEPLPNISFGEVTYRKLLDKEEQHLALIDGNSGKKLTYGDMLSKTCSLAEALRNAGYGPNTVLAISSRNNLEYFHPIIASLYIGAILAPINYEYTPTELNHILHLCKPSVIFCSKALLEKFHLLQNELDFIQAIVVIDSEESTSQAECLNDFITRNLKGPWVSRTVTSAVDVEDHIAFILSSSGTTGLPKGVMLTHDNLNTVYEQFRDPRIHDQSYISLCVPPFFHCYGLMTTLAGILINGPVVFLAEFEGGIFLKTIEEYKISRLFVVPPLAIFLAKHSSVPEHDLSSIKEIICAAAPLKASTEKEIKDRLNLKVIRQAYGLTETTCAVIFNGKDELNCKPGSSGKVIPYMQVAVRDLESGKFLGPNLSGEICMKGHMVMKGYYGNAEATRNTFTEDGWLLSGDIGYYDEEGYFYITDRIKELIKFKGYQVAPAELEALLLTHPEIIDSGVIGLPDERAGELPFAFVVKRVESKLQKEDVQNFVAKKLSHQKWLRGGVMFVDQIPKSPSGKILRKDLKRLLREMCIKNLNKCQ